MSRGATQGEAGPSSTAQHPAYRHTFTQVLMHRGFMPDSEAKHLYRRITSASNDAQYFSFLREINEQLEYANFELRRIQYPGDQQEYIGFVNKEADEESRRAVRYRGKDGKPDVRVTTFFRAVLESIATEEGGRGELPAITSSEALNLQLTLDVATQAATQGDAQASQAVLAALGELSKRDKERALGELVQKDGWLAVPPNRPGSYTLGVRSLLELGDYIRALDLQESTRQLLERVV